MSAKSFVSYSQDQSVFCCQVRTVITFLSRLEEMQCLILYRKSLTLCLTSFGPRLCASHSPTFPCLGAHALDDIKVSIPAVAHGYQPHLVAFRLDRKVLAGVCYSETMTVFPPPSHLVERLCHLFAPTYLAPKLLVSLAILLCYAPPTRTAPHNFCFTCSPDVSAKALSFGACLCPFRIMHFNYVRGRIELKHEQHLANRPITSEEQ